MSRCQKGLVVALLATALLACGDETATPEPAGVFETPPECVSSDEAFIKRAIHEVWGRKPRSIREVEVLQTALDSLGRPDLIRAMTRSPEYVFRWSHVLRDLLFINRAGERIHDECNLTTLLPQDTGQLAQWMRDSAPGGAAYEQPFTMLDAIESALRLDDLSPVLRAQPFEMVASRLHRADQDQHELAFRKLYAELFERNYLHRRMECLRCHNSEFSVTPAYPVAGLVDREVFGSSDGRDLSDLMPFFRIRGVLAMEFDESTDPYWFYGSGISPWGWTPGCGQFIAPPEITPDPLSDTAFLSGVAEPANVWVLEERLRAGFASLRQQPQAELTPDRALASMVATRIAEGVWQRVTGKALTVAHYLPRNPWQGELLQQLADTFVTHGFSLREVLVATLTHPYVVQADVAACSAAQSPYWMAPIFDPWSTENLQADTQLNALGDVAGRAAPRVLMNSVIQALDWTDSHTLADEFGTFDDRLELHIDLGLFVMDGEPGFRGANLQEALAWEEAYGACRDPFTSGDGGQDWIDRLLAAATDEHSIEDAVIALKDRLVTDPSLDDFEERSLIQALAGRSLDEPILALDRQPTADEALRRVCAAVLSSPQFTMSPSMGPDRTGSPIDLLLPESQPQALCQKLVQAMWPNGGAACGQGQIQLLESPR